jgi:hypothetical protein
MWMRARMPSGEEMKRRSRRSNAISNPSAEIFLVEQKIESNTELNVDHVDDVSRSTDETPA